MKGVQRQDGDETKGLRSVGHFCTQGGCSRLRSWSKGNSNGVVAEREAISYQRSLSYTSFKHRTYSCTLCVCVCAIRHTFYDTHVQVGGQPCKVFLPPLYGIQGLNSVVRPVWTPLPMESCRTLLCIIGFNVELSQVRII